MSVFVRSLARVAVPNELQVAEMYANGPLRDEEEALLATGRELRSTVPDGASRRQVVVRGLTLNSTVGKRLSLGEVLVAVTGLCHPCENMERAIGPGAQMAMANRGGVSARVLHGGTLRPGDQILVRE